jgi:hypothetical protein
MAHLRKDLGSQGFEGISSSRTFASTAIEVHFFQFLSFYGRQVIDHGDYPIDIFPLKENVF